MAKDQSKSADTTVDKPSTEQGAVAAAPAAEITLNEFCIRLSRKEKRVELIGGFEFEERLAKRLKDTEENYSARFQAFIKKPA